MNSYLYIINMISREFELKYPKLYKQYLGWCCESKWLLSENESLNFLLLTNTKDLINYVRRVLIELCIFFSFFLYFFIFFFF